MLKVLIIYLALCSLTHAVYISQMSPINRMTAMNRVRSPTAFRPGVNLQNLQTVQRPWTFGSMRLATVASNRAPYVLYRNQPQRYAIKHYGPSSTRNIFTRSPWKTTARQPAISSFVSQYEFMKPLSAQSLFDIDGGTGAIHTIPAPNLSLSEKPIVVLETSEKSFSGKAKSSYEVTEKYPDGEHNTVKIEPPVGFSKENSIIRPELKNVIKDGGAEYSLKALSVNQHHQLVPQQFHMQNFNNLPSPQDLINTGTEGIFIPPNALYQSDPMFLQKLQGQLMQRFPALEFIPYAPDMTYQGHLHPQQQASQNHPEIVLLENEQLNRPLAIHVPKQGEQKNVVQRETQESSVVTLIPQAFTAPNTTVMQIEETTPKQPQNITLEPVSAASQPVTTTIKSVIEKNTEEQNTTPIYYAQVGQSIGSVIANGFYSAINDVRAASAMAQVGKTSEATIEDKTTTTTTIPDLKAYFVKTEDKSENKTTELKPLLGVPFKKATESVNVTYTLIRPDDKQSKINEEGAVYAGQIVQATISEDQDFNKQKESLITRRAPIRLFAVADSNNIESASNTPSVSEVTVVKAKIPAKSKLTFDDKTGEPILRIYASYVDTPSQKDAIIAKLSTLKPNKDSIIKRDSAESRKGTTVKSTEKNQGFDANQGFVANQGFDANQGYDANRVTQFGLKLKHRSDDYIPLFEDYDD